MKIILQDPDTNELYKIEPFDNGLCYRIFKNVEHKKGAATRNGHVVKNDWSFTEKYPCSLSHAIGIVIEMMLCNKDSDTAINSNPDDIRKAVNKYFKNMTQKIIESIEIKED